MRWDEEILFYSGDEYFASMAEALAHAKVSIELESYIFDDDNTGRKIVELLFDAARRGVGVRVLVDGFGAADFIRQYEDRFACTTAQIKVYNPIPWILRLALMRGLIRFAVFSKWMSKINRRNHRKTCIVDSKTMYTGSFNVSDVHSRSINQEHAWRDTGIRVAGFEVKKVQKAFEHTWNRAWPKTSMTYLSRQYLKRGTETFSSPLLRINTLIRDRLEIYRRLRDIISTSRERIWITNAYFVPRMRFLRKLMRASRRGVDVRVIVPKVSDVPIVKRATEFYYSMMKDAGIRIFEYEKSVLHAKTMIVDNWAIVGTSNLNHRSFLHDLELDVVLTDPATIEELSRWYVDDQANSSELKSKMISERSWLDRLISSFARMFRYWM